jgi:hypothetical protein
VDIFDTDDAYEIDIAVMVVERELHQTPDGLLRLQLSQVQLTFSPPNVAVEFLQDFDVELFLAAEIVIDHALRGFRALSDGVDPRPGQPLADEFDNRRLEDVLAGLFRVIFTALVQRLDRLKCTGIGEFRHSGLTTTVESGDYGLSAFRKEVSAQRIVGSGNQR